MGIRRHQSASNLIEMFREGTHKYAVAFDVKSPEGKPIRRSQDRENTVTKRHQITVAVTDLDHAHLVGVVEQITNLMQVSFNIIRERQDE